jgi:protein-tyrosine phosphatase
VNGALRSLELMAPYRVPPAGEAGSLTPVRGTLNFRDLGGYRTSAGGRVRTGQVFRSDHLNDVTDEGFAVLHGLGLRTVIDLRFEHERTAQPSRLPTDVTVVLASPIGMEAAAVDFVARIHNGEVASYTAADAARHYREMVVSGVQLFVTTFTVLADDAQRPALFHCTAGKDRTGLTAALLLDLLGVPLDDIRRDYWLTNPYRTAHRIASLRNGLAQQGVDVEQVRAMFAANLEALDAALELVAANGGAERFLRDHGLSSDAIAALRDGLVAP